VLKRAYFMTDQRRVLPGNARYKQTRDAFQSSRLTAVRSWTVIG